jgi:hypothetical protein
VVDLECDRNAARDQWGGGRRKMYLPVFNTLFDIDGVLLELCNVRGICDIEHNGFG